MSNKLKIWISVPTKYFKYPNYYDYFSKHALHRDVRELRRKVMYQTETKCDIRWFNPNKHQWGYDFEEFQQEAHLHLFYLVPHASGYLGKGAYKCVKKYSKPKYLMYRTENQGRQLRFYLFSFPEEDRVDEDDWHNYALVKFYRHRTIHNIINDELDKMCSSEPAKGSKIEQFRTEEFMIPRFEQTGDLANQSYVELFKYIE